MANIPPIRRSLAPLSNLNKRGQMRFGPAEEIDENKRATFAERRFSKDRRLHNIKIFFDRRKRHDRRNKTQLNRSNSDNHTTTGLTIDTTA